MHTILPPFLALYLAHLVAEFVIQPGRMLAEKKKGKWRAYAAHGAIHLLAATLCAAFVNVAWARNLRLYAVLLGLTLVHLLIDWGKFALAASGPLSDGVAAFALDQFAHAGTVLLAAALLTGVPLSDFASQLAVARIEKEKILWVLAVYVGVIFGGGYTVRYLTRPLVRRTSANLEETADQLENAGMYIGWLERFLVLTALALQSPATIGLILTAKSIARYPEFKSVWFAEYFLIGTLLSLSIGIVGGLVLLKALYGTIRM